ncbi:7978_t:CDS:2, partial [Dentiscutata heterogama]
IKFLSSISLGRSSYTAVSHHVSRKFDLKDIRFLLSFSLGQVFCATIFVPYIKFLFSFSLGQAFFAAIFVPYFVTMVRLPKIPDTPDDFNNIVNYLQHGVFAEKYNSPLKKSNFQR